MRSGTNCTLAASRSNNPGSFGGARKAIQKSWAEEGEEGVTMIAGRGDFSDASGRERSTKESISKLIIDRIEMYLRVRV